MENESYLRTILGGTDFRSLSLMEKIECINVVLLWLCKRRVKKIWDSHIQFSDFTDFLGCRILSLLRYANEIQELVDKEYICRNRDEGF